MMNDILQDAAWDAEDAGKEVFIQRHEQTGIIEYIEIDGVETYNPDYVDEVRDVFDSWVDASSAERMWRE